MDFKDRLHKAASLHISTVHEFMAHIKPLCAEFANIVSEVSGCDVQPTIDVSQDGRFFRFILSPIGGNQVDKLVPMRVVVIEGSIPRKNMESVLQKAFDIATKDLGRSVVTAFCAYYLGHGYKLYDKNDEDSALGNGPHGASPVFRSDGAVDEKHPRTLRWVRQQLSIKELFEKGDPSDPFGIKHLKE